MTSKFLIAFLTSATVCRSNLAIAQSTNKAIPESRWIHQLTYDEKNSRILLFGGATNGKLLGDLWSLKGSQWKKLSESGPPPRCKSVFVYDPSRNVAVLVGGQTENDKLIDDTWEWNGTNWKQIMVAGPPARNHAMAAYDSKHKETILFGGFGTNGLLNDTWSFDGISWRLKNSGGPQKCLPHLLYYDEQDQKIIMITVSLDADPKDSLRKSNEMWEWAGDRWKKLDEPAPSTSRESLQVLSSFGKAGIVLFDGDDKENNRGAYLEL